MAVARTVYEVVAQRKAKRCTVVSSTEKKLACIFSLNLLYAGNWILYQELFDGKYRYFSA